MNNKRRRSSTTFIKILCTISFNVIMVTVILSAVLLFNFERIMIRNISNTNLRLLSQIKNSVSYINRSAYDFGLAIFSNNDSRNLMYMKHLPQNDDERLRLFNSIRRLDNSVKSVSYVHSVYLYNSALDYYFSTSSPTMSTREAFLDQEIIPLVDKVQDSNIRLQPRRIPVYKAGGDIAYEDVYTYIYYDNEFSFDGKSDAVVVNLKSDWLTQAIYSLNELDQLYTSKKSKVFLMDGKGKIINHPDRTLFLKDVSEKSYIKKILGSSYRSDWFIDNVDGSNAIITYINPEDIHGLSVVSVTPYKDITDKLDAVRKVTMVTFLAMLILGMLIAYVLSIRVYSPIGNLANNVRRFVFSNEVDGKKEKDEINFIHEAFNQTISKSYELENFKRTHEGMIRQEALRSILLKADDNPAQRDQKLDELQIRIFQFQSVVLVVFRIDHFADFISRYNVKDQSLMRFAIKNIAEEIFSSAFYCETVDMNTDHIVVMTGYNSEKMEEDQAEAHICEAALKTQAACLEHLKISVSCAVSRQGDSIEGIEDMYRETLNFSNYRMVCGYGCMITFQQAEQYANTEFTYAFDKQNILVAALKQGKLDVARSAFDELASIIRQFSFPNIMLSYTYLSSGIFNTLAIMENNGSFRMETDYYTFNKQISNMETVEEINRSFFDLFAQIGMSMKEAKIGKQDRNVESIMEMIKKNYQDPNLSLDFFSDHLKMSSVYLGKLFRETTGLSIADYINTLRLEKTKELLVKTNLTVEEIADKVGITNNKYLFRIFKKEYGVTPGEYRLKNTNL